MQGKNPIRPPVMDDGARLQVKSIFPTLQGEGPRTGQPAVFIRLAGCNLACDFCDTLFEDGSEMTLASILDAATALKPRLAVITGGEPLRQNIVPLCKMLIDAGFTVQIETNGTLWRELPREVEIVCSPKNPGRGYSPLRPDLLPRITALKFIVSATHPLYRGIPELGQSAYPRLPVYIQPMDEGDKMKNAANTALAEELAVRNKNHVSLQMHKVWHIA